ncbi:DUF1014-domain-containing protein [Choiromyces venosus 120613-1]|uniref:DUF1014-domain-containing protein n=1 Tax=Choiromyces venosus 120613-1 TaxID=1336337 RepID=A0A3N4JFS8_9PEZI|nr:DUF1014-domain-containing protein [Choiromyces venosus 120613-1]
MPPKRGENTRKVAGNAKKAAAAAAKADAENARKAAEEAQEWDKGAKSNAKKEAAEAKKRDAAAKKAAAAAALAEEEAALPSKPKPMKTGPAKRTRGIDSALGSLSASNVDDALDALTLATGADKSTIDRHPEKRFKAAYAVYEERRLPEVREEHKGLRLGQMKELIKKEFEKSEENPFNQVGNVHYNATRDEIALAKKAEMDKIEARLGGK